MITDDFISVGFTLQVSRAAFEQWWMVSDPKRSPLQRDIENRLDGFFHFMRESHRRAMITGLGVLIDHADNSLAVPAMLKRMEADGHDCRRETKLWEASKHLRDKVWLVRCKLYAHRNGQKTDKEWFEKANLRAWEIRRLTVVLQAIISSLRHRLGMSPVDFYPFNEPHTRRAINLIMKGYDAGLA